MTLTLDLAPEKETRLQQRAARAGLTLDEYVLRMIDQAAEEPAPEMTPAERAARFRDWAASHGTDTPLLSEEAISREAIYSRD